MLTSAVFLCCLLIFSSIVFLACYIKKTIVCKYFPYCLKKQLMNTQNPWVIELVYPETSEQCD